MSTTISHTRSQLMNHLNVLGVDEGQIIMLHSSVKAVGAVMGGPNAILQAILDTLGRDGTLMMYAGWQDIPDFVLDLPIEARQVYYDEHPPFDPATARAVRDHSILAEFLRTWPGAERSLNPEASMVALGIQAKQLTQDHPLDYGYGAGSPLAKLVEHKGKVLMLGAPLDTITLLHYAENRARMAHKNIVRYQCPILRDGQKVWVDVEDYDTGKEHADYTFDGIARAYVAEGRGTQGSVGNAESYLFDAADLAAFAITWLEVRFG
ncbi:aminoglycoside 3-N-acetyltransferase [Pseudomonas aeruginosa]|uniref:Aminoglycoside N(3)-acetyltransferase n=6 Tax=Pseudomonadota TaxID=1224 RepID=A0A5J6AAR6_PSEAI|nr:MULTISPECIES: aminoglycoside 3-N-acetyltransferase [Pseudomonadota]AWS89996.1 aminoglycoside 3-N-acetyltransferase [Pseudomonas aeruginosa]AWT28776.1 aminoglycoside 3-N-acetyltransferase [Pseudomonas aeruginosa]AXZ94893.1 aminoglycoside 3-N-acetyltransferase [Pseudomonas aeruginosa]EIU2923869.1 aminoglycoside 3-N-acetyltransferase [Pseudomonas aeruginosa]EJM8451705.1 aminoglycoside 3-N-acetyltransferase [Pseudomonas aeruginosa]